jgi:hypothetical protein
MNQQPMYYLETDTAWVLHNAEEEQKELNYVCTGLLFIKLKAYPSLITYKIWTPCGAKFLSKVTHMYNTGYVFPSLDFLVSYLEVSCQTLTQR